MHHSPTTLFQTGTLCSFLECHYEGDTELQVLKSHGDFGIGTFNCLDGELIFLDGEFYQTQEMGNIAKPSWQMKTPLATALFFQKEKEFSMKNISSMENMEKEIFSHLSSKNLLYAIRIEGTFEKTILRSVVKQKPPFRSFKDHPELVSEYQKPKVEGTILALHFPSFLRSLNVEGFHFHFIDNEKKWGGHLCSTSIVEAKGQICPIENFSLHLSRWEEFQQSKQQKT